MWEGGSAALRRVIQVSEDPLEWKSGQEKVYFDSIQLITGSRTVADIGNGQAAVI